MRRFLLFGLLLLMACGPRAEADPDAVNRGSQGILRIFATQDFYSSGLEAVLIDDFEKQQNCLIELSLFDDVNQMISAVIKDSIKADIVFGLPSSFVAADSLTGYFLPYSPANAEDLSGQRTEGNSSRLIPYGFSHLSLVYNTKMLDDPPSSFGELQDARFLRQMAILDPDLSGPGLAEIHWIISLFGTSGYTQALRALRKNVSRQYPHHSDALNSLKSGENSLMIGLSTWPAWQKEIYPDSAVLDFVLFDEGSYLYTECMGLHKSAANLALAAAFIDFVLSPSAQKLITYKLGLFPVNRKTMLPPAFSDVPLSPWMRRSQIKPEDIFQDNDRWLSYWQRYLMP